MLEYSNIHHKYYRYMKPVPAKIAVEPWHGALTVPAGATGILTALNQLHYGQ